MELNPINMGLITIILILLFWLGYYWRRERRSSEAVKRIVNETKDNLQREMKKCLDNGETITGLYLINAAFCCSRYYPSIHIDYGIYGDEWFFFIHLGNECEKVSGPISKVKENDR